MNPLKLLTKFAKIITATQHALLPSPCECCGALHTCHQGSVVCADCEALAFPVAVRCQQCGLRLGIRLQAFGWTRCRHCRFSPNDTRTWVAGDYVAPMDEWAIALKFRGKEGLAVTFANALARTALMEEDFVMPDVLIPMPVSKKRLEERGYNQALLIARRLGHQLNVACDAHCLIKTRETQKQSGLSAQQRQHNLGDAFVVAGNVENLHIGLVDDVMTTGATLAAARNALSEHGVVRFSQWIAFRTPERPEDD
jgi:ComF family protein